MNSEMSRLPPESSLERGLIVSTKSVIESERSIPSPEPKMRASQSVVKRTIEMWPYVLLTISLTGLLYIAVNAAH
jgi:hypothetical protein